MRLKAIQCMNWRLKYLMREGSVRPMTFIEDFLCDIMCFHVNDTDDHFCLNKDMGSATPYLNVINKVAMKKSSTGTGNIRICGRFETRCFSLI
jgi:hypothetical protein